MTGGGRMELRDTLYNKVRLRAMEPEDLDFLYELENDESLWNVGNTNVPYSRSLLLDYITSSRADIYADRQVRMVMENDAAEPVGFVDLVDFDPRHSRAELGIVVADRFRGQGYAFAALGKICDYARSVVGLHQIYAIVDKNNEICTGLLKTFGFQLDTELKGWLRRGSVYEDAYLFQYFL